MVAYIDILGTSERLQRLDDIAHVEFVDQQIDIINEVTAPQELFRKVFTDFLDTGFANLQSEIGIWRNIFNPQYGISFFSDSMIIGMPLDTYADPLMQKSQLGIFGTIISFPLKAFLSALCIASLACASRGVLIRGGIEYGTAVQFGDKMSEITGSPLVEAAAIENKIKIPRIGIGYGLSQHLKLFSLAFHHHKMEISPFYDEIMDFNIKNVDFYKNIFHQDGGHSILDFLSPHFLKQFNEEAIRSSQLEMVREIEKGITKYSSNDSILKKYMHLREYLKTRISQERYDEHKSTI